MKRKKPRRSIGIWVRGYVPLTFLIIILCITIQIYFTKSGMFQQLEGATNKSMQVIVQARSNYISNAMAQRWAELTTAVQSVNSLYDEMVISNAKTTQQVISQEELYVEFLNASITPAIDVLRRNSVSGVFLVLADSDSVSARNTPNMPGFFLRDRDPSSAYNKANTDLLFLRAPIGIIQRSGISTDTYWAPNFTIEPNGDLGKTFFQIYETASENPDVDPLTLGCWSEYSTVQEDISDTFFFAVPLIASTGEVYGIMGIDITKSYFTQFLPYQELSDGEGAYALYKTQSDGSTNFVTSFSKSGKYMDDFWLNLTDSPVSISKTLTYDYDTTYSVQTVPLSIYDAHSPYANEKWYIYAAVPNSVLYTTTESTLHHIRILIVWLSVVTALGVGTIIYQLANPLKRLERQLKACKLDCEELHLIQTGISELDLLSNAIEKLNTDVRASAGKFSQLLEMSSISLGAFEFDKLTGHWFISENFFRVFDDGATANTPDLESTLERLQLFEAHAIQNTIVNTTENHECVCEIPRKNNQFDFVRIKIQTTEKYTRGVVEDVSIEWQEIRKLAYERNHDSLTDIYNRRGFYENYYALLNTSSAQHKIAAVIMLDLDNLKLLNDTYGHNIGDLYIQTTAKVLKSHAGEHAIVSRISGDEFLVFAHGYDNLPDCNKFISQLKKNLSSEKICIGKDTFYPLHVSAGIAYCPTDSTDGNELVRFADFAMYQGKRTFKGRFTLFDPKAYAKEMTRLEAKEALNQFILNKEVLFHFQPIVCAKTMTVFAYEALMRPQNYFLKTPFDVLTVAKAEHRLQEIEALTILGATNSFIEWCQQGVIANPECKLFLNTITNETLTSEELAIVIETFKDYLPRIVVEFTEDEKPKKDIVTYKQEFLTEWGASTALDDYGSGYNGENMLLETKSKYIKLDINMIKNIHIDSNRKQRVIDLLNYAHPRGIFVIAEGVELLEECIVLRELGVDFLQGYYLARPALVPPVPDIDALFQGNLYIEKT